MSKALIERYFILVLCRMDQRNQRGPELVLRYPSIEGQSKLNEMMEYGYSRSNANLSQILRSGDEG